MTTIRGFEMTGTGRALAPARREIGTLEPDDVLIRVAGCGVCHTDLGFLHDGVRTRHALPLILGHEVSGYVEDAGSRQRALVGQAVVVPAVLPCGECALCRAGRSTICASQIMPGNDRDGGFATHVVLPGRFLCPVPGAGAGSRRSARQAPGTDAAAPGGRGRRRLDGVPGGRALGRPLGASSPSSWGSAAWGSSPRRSRPSAARPWSASTSIRAGGKRPRRSASRLALDPREISGKELRGRIASFARESGAPATGWTILECSGTPAGQQTAFGLLVHGATLMVVGFTLETVSVRLSNLMAFDARALGNWGCAPELYPAILEKVLAGRIDVASHAELRPLSKIAEVLEDVRAHRVERRVVLVPDAEEVS